MEEWQCDLVKDFINDNGDVSLVYVISGRGDSCEEMTEFIQEMKMESKFYIYCNIRANSN